MKRQKRIIVSSIILILALLNESLGAAEFVDPPSGSAIANFEGSTLSTVTITCNITITEGLQITTQWNLENFRGSGTNLVAVSDAPELFSVGGDPIPGTNFLFENELTILNWAAELDGVIVYCGTGQDPQQASFTLRIYRVPKLQDNFMVKIEEGRQNITVDLRQDPAAFPEPTLFSWSKDGQPLSVQTELTLTYSTITITTVRRADAGNYSVAATNFILPGSSGTLNEVGYDTGSFYLDVIYGPSLSLGTPLHYALLGGSASLLCGTDLDSNPQATITWTAPDGTMIMDNDRFTLEYGPDVVRLTVSRTLLSDVGVWRCDIRTESDQYIMNNGILTQTNISAIGEPIQHDIELIIIVPPGQPHTLSVKESDATLLQICWEAPVQSDSQISYYTITVCNLNSTIESNKVITDTTSNMTFYNVTGLLPGTTYELTVVAVSRGGDVAARSQPSDPIIDRTGVTVPQLFCNASVLADGAATVTWSYIHTGGLPLTNVSVSYHFGNGLSPIPIPFISVDATLVTIPDLKAGFQYTFNVTAENNEGSSSTLCGPITPKSVPLDNTAAIIGGVLGGLVTILLITLLVFVTATVTLALRRRGSQLKLEAVYEYPDNVQQYTPKKDNIELEECPAYVEKRKDDIKLEQCPAYGQSKTVNQDIDCPAYVEKCIKLEECPAYGQHPAQERPRQ